MANVSKDERKLVGVRIPVHMLAKIKNEAQRQGLGLNDFYVSLIYRGLAQESGRAPSQISQHTGEGKTWPAD